MSFTRQDAVTFGVGLAAALLVTLGEALVRSGELAEDPGKWAVGLGTGLAAAAGRYLVTELTQRGFRG